MSAAAGEGQAGEGQAGEGQAGEGQANDVWVAVGGLGPDLFDLLAARVDEVKADDPLAPITVVVGANSVGVATRRHLARHRTGIVGATFLTPYRLGELVGGAALAERGLRPVSNPILGAAARHALASTSTRYSTVAQHPATELALVRSFHELDVLDDEELAKLEATGRRGRDVVMLYRAMRRRIATDYHTERDLLDAAIARINDGGLPRELGHVIVFDPIRVARPARRLLRAIGTSHELSCIVGLAGDPHLDAPVHELVADLGATPVSFSFTADRAADVIVSVSDPDDEARETVRRVIAAAQSGVALERIAVVFPNRAPYARLLHEHLTAAGIPHNGAAVRTLADSVAGRTVWNALSLSDRGFRRSDVLALATSAPLRHGGRAVRATAWERHSRRAGVVGGLDQWRERLSSHAADANGRPDIAADCAELVEFVESIAERLERAERARRWEDISALASEFVRRCLPGDVTRSRWPVEEQQAYERVQLAIDRLAGLDTVDPGPTLDTYRRALAAELDTDLGRIGRIGEGVLVGSLEHVAGVPTDAVFVVGLAEGSFPARHQDDSLIPDSDRAAVGTDLLADRRRRARAEHRRLLGVLAMCSGTRTLLHPRGDLRRTVDRPLSRYALDAAEALGGTRPGADAVLGLDEPWFDLVPSFAAGVSRGEVASTAQDARLRHLVLGRIEPRQLSAHPLVLADHVLARAVALLRARASDSFTRFDGNLTSRTMPSLTAADSRVSPTRLQQYATNPFGYFLTYVLGLSIVESPEVIERMTALDKGSLYHEILEAFLVEVLERPAPPKPDEPWTESDQTRLHEIADERAAAYERHGLSGRALYWRQDRRRLHADLDRFLEWDRLHRRDHRATPLAAEFSFGRGDAAPVPYRLRDGRVLNFVGSADRIDSIEDGGYWVTDYKTGKRAGFENLSEHDPDDRGRKLQLPVYAHAVRVLREEPHAPVTAAYHFLTREGSYGDVRVPLLPMVEERVDAVLGAITDLVERGVFPNSIGPSSSWNRTFPSVVDPDGRGVAELHRQWLAKSRAPELADYVEWFCEPEAEDADDETAPGRPVTSEAPTSEGTTSEGELR